MTRKLYNGPSTGGPPGTLWCDVCQTYTAKEQSGSLDLFNSTLTAWFCPNDHGRCAHCDQLLHGPNVRARKHSQGTLCQPCYELIFR